MPDDHTERVYDTMIPNLKGKTFLKEVHYNATCLLAAAITFYMYCSFSKAFTMKEVQECFMVHTKQLSLCIMGRKYQSGTERIAKLKRKRKSVPSEMARKDPSNNDNNGTQQKVKDRLH